MKINSMLSILLVISILSCILFASCSSNALPVKPTQNVSEDTTEDNTTLKIKKDGITLKFAADLGNVFIDGNNRIQAPLRALSTCLNIDITWIGETSTVVIKKDDLKAEFYPDQKDYKLNSSTIQIDTAPIIKNSRIYLPVRFIGELLGYDVKWEPTKNSVNLIEPKGIAFVEQIKNDKNISSRKCLFQLQNANIGNIIGFKPKIAIVDIDSKCDTNKSSSKFEKIDTQKLLDNNVLPISYISIGEAETYRSYWKKYNNASFMGAENKEWKGNYKVRFWDETWQKITFENIDNIYAQGFKGIFLDIVDAYYYWGNFDENGEEQRPGDPKSESESALRMIDFVSKISAYCKQKDPNFLIIPNNATDINQYDINKQYLNAVDGLVIESLWFEKTKQLTDEEHEKILKCARDFKQNKKPVLAVDYIYDKNDTPDNNKSRISSFTNSCVQEGFYYYPSTVDQQLDSILIPTK